MTDDSYYVNSSWKAKQSKKSLKKKLAFVNLPPC